MFLCIAERFDTKDTPIESRWKWRRRHNEHAWLKYAGDGITNENKLVHIGKIKRIRHQESSFHRSVIVKPQPKRPLDRRVNCSDC
jgi:hypothetical protein